MSTLISLVSHENMPNIIAAIALKPDRLAFLVTSAFSETSYPYLCNLLRKKLPKLYAILDYRVDAYSIESAKSACEKAIIEISQIRICFTCYRCPTSAAVHGEYFARGVWACL